MWVEPETKTEKVWVEPVTHEEPIYEEQRVYICNDCGADVTEEIKKSNAGEDIPPEKRHIYQELMNGGKSSWHSEYRQVQTGTKTVVDKEGYYKNETVKVKVSDGYWKTITVKEADWY